MSARLRICCSTARRLRHADAHDSSGGACRGQYFEQQPRKHSPVTTVLTAASLRQYPCKALLTGTQAVLQQLLDMGIVGGLPEDLQWTIRMLLPKPPSCAFAVMVVMLRPTCTAGQCVGTHECGHDISQLACFMVLVMCPEACTLMRNAVRQTIHGMTSTLLSIVSHHLIHICV